MIKKILISFIFFGLLTGLRAQQAASKFYVINDIRFEGLSYYNPRTVRAFIGVSKGDVIEVPGTLAADIINRLWTSGEFDDVEVYVQPIDDTKADLIIKLKEVPTLSSVKFKGIPKSRAKSFIEDLKLDKGKIHVNRDLLKRIERHVKEHYIGKGYLHAEVKEKVIPDTIKGKAKILVSVNKGNRVKIAQIRFHGDKAFNKFLIFNGKGFSDSRLRGKLKNTKRINPFRFWKSSKFIRDKYEEDKHRLVEYYQSKGYRNARIVKDSIYWVGPDEMGIDLWINEGKKYYFGNIRFVGNSVYSDKQLSKVLDIRKGDVYNGKLLKERIANPKKPDAVDLTNLYQNNGYLFSRITPMETGIRGDSIDFEIRIYEGKVAYFNNITVKGNERTKDYVILREVRTLPGEKYNKELVVRTVRELAQLGFFNPEAISPNFKNVDPVNGRVDIEWNVEEGGASQIQLQGGYGGKTFIGTVMLNLNNFAGSEIFKKNAWKPVPMGEGQKLGIQANFSVFFEYFSFNFSEPWLGGKKPQALSLSIHHSQSYMMKEHEYRADRSRKFRISGVTLSLSKRLQWPDDHFQISHALSFDNYRLINYYSYGNTISGLFGFKNGVSNNVYYNLILGRASSGPNPIFPLGGNDFVLSVKLTPPYSMFSSTNYAHLDQFPEYQDKNGNPDYAKINQAKYRWLEYYKIKFSGTWYTRLYKKLVLRTKTDVGFMGSYNKALGVPPFERFYIGGSGMQYGGFYDSRDIIPLRGYDDLALNNEALSGRNKGGVVYNKFSLELRYPLTLKPQASIWVLGFAEGANTFSDIRRYNPFTLKRSAGVGLRVFMQMFGLLGIDFGYGFDPVYNRAGVPVKQGWHTHFIINQQL